MYPIWNCSILRLVAGGQILAIKQIHMIIVRIQGGKKEVIEFWEKDLYTTYVH
jgi:hypothetical protein